MDEFSERMMLHRKYRNDEGLPPEMIISLAKMELKLAKRMGYEAYPYEPTLDQSKFVFLVAHIDGANTPKEIIERAQANDLDGVASAVADRHWGRYLVYSGRWEMMMAIRDLSE